MWESRLIIPGLPPSVNHMYKNAVVRGRNMKVLTTKAADWGNEAIYRATMWRNRNKWKTVSGKVIVKLWFYFPDARKRDTHNTLKLMLDCFEDARIYDNDKYALPQIMDFEIDRTNPRVEIEFEVKEA